jgi:hypothetical protein
LPVSCSICSDDAKTDSSSSVSAVDEVNDWRQKLTAIGKRISGGKEIGLMLRGRNKAEQDNANLNRFQINHDASTSGIPIDNNLCSHFPAWKPSLCEVGRIVFYDVDDLNAWANAQKRSFTLEALAGNPHSTQQ